MDYFRAAVAKKLEEERDLNKTETQALIDAALAKELAEKPPSAWAAEEWARAYETFLPDGKRLMDGSRPRSPVAWQGLAAVIMRLLKLLGKGGEANED